jgi:metal-responsive CopG/Arc/MetJ family transcriptional regulator
MRGSSKVKTSITLSSDLLKAIDRTARDGQSRSEFIEAALRVFFAQLQRRERDSRDLAIFSEHADRLNAEAKDVLTYQIIP